MNISIHHLVRQGVIGEELVEDIIHTLTESAYLHGIVRGEENNKDSIDTLQQKVDLQKNEIDRLNIQAEMYESLYKGIIKHPETLLKIDSYVYLRLTEILEGGAAPNHKIEAIKHLRESYPGMYLKDAKELVENLLHNLGE